MRLPSDGTPRDPRILCVGLALRQALPVLPFDPGLTAAVHIIVREAERFQPDPFELTYAWDTALDILLDMATECRCGPLGDILLQYLATRPYTADGR
jgi:hypothetical protein